MAISCFITYDLNQDEYGNPDEKHDKVINMIKSELAIDENSWFSKWESSYLIKTNLSCDEIVDKLDPLFDKGDKLIVFNVTNSERQGFLSRNKKEWEAFRAVCPDPKK